MNRIKLSKGALAVLGFAAALFLSCTDIPDLKFPSYEEVLQKASSSSIAEQPYSSSVEAAVSSSFDGSSSSEEPSSSSSEKSSSSEEESSSSESEVESSSSGEVPTSSSSDALCDGDTLQVNQFCYEDKIGNLCGDREQTYDPDLYGCNGDINPNGIYLKDGMEGKYSNTIYKAVLIGGQVWMAENINYENDSYRECFFGEQYCMKHGRLYNWEEAKSVCPNDWSLPTSEDWAELKEFVGSAQKLKDENDWGEGNGGTDDYGFAALMDGYCNDVCSLTNGKWWTTSEKDSDKAWSVIMDEDNNITKVPGNKTDYYSVRCIKRND